MDIIKLNSFDKDIRDIIYGLINLYDSECSEIILYGSTAKNELSIKENDNGLDIFYPLHI